MTSQPGKIPPQPAANEIGVYEFGHFRVDLRQKLLLRSGEPIKLPQKTFDVLMFLVRNNGKTVEKAALMDAVWAGSFVEEANITVHISRLRKIFNADESPAATIETFPKVGYRFTATELRRLPAAVSGEFPDSQFTGSTETAAKTEGSIRLSPIETAAKDQTEKRAAARRMRIATLALIIAVLVFGSGYLLRGLYGRSAGGSMVVTRVPGTEQSSSIAYSPNGEYVAHTVSSAGKRTLTVTNVNSGSSLPLLPADDSSYLGLTFTRDSSFLYFVKAGPEFNSLYKIPILGGTATHVLDQVDGRISFSPAGDRFCFLRKGPEGTTSIIIVNTDGSGQRELSRRSAPQFYSGFEISWSPDGRLIANAAGATGNNPNIQLVGVEVDAGGEIVLNDRKWSGVDGLEWMRDGSGLVAGAFDGTAAPIQVYFIPYPTGEPRRITNDLENYGSVGVSADGSTIMAGQFKDNTSVWVVPPGTPARAEPVKAGKHHKFHWVRWAPDGGFVFGSDAGGNRDVWRMGLDGTGEKELSSGPQSNVMPVATADGRYIIFSAFRDDNGLFELWRMGPDGSDQVQLTRSGAGAWQPSVSPDGRWVFYTSGPLDGPPANRRIWKISIEGGEPTLFTDRIAYQPDISPDGKYLACWIKTDEKSKPQAAIFPVEGGEPRIVLDGPGGNRLDWTPDGKGLSYIVTTGGVSNVWTQPLDGGPPHQETQFTSETIRSFDWSADARLLVSRYFKTRDVILIRNFR